MSFQLLVATALAGAAALWFLNGALGEFMTKGTSAPGCGTCSAGCPLQAPSHPSEA